MSTGVPGRTRARDIDRARTAGNLDAAYAEGQLSAAEYHDRIAAARVAKTLGELSDLVADLQQVADAPPAVVPAPRSEYPPSTRARTVDRRAAGELLDRAYGEGQLTEDEHRAATELLAEATTLGDLADITADLQGSRPTPVAPRPPASGRSGRYFAVLTAAALAVAFGAYMLAGRDTGSAASAPPPAAVAPVPEDPRPAPGEPEPLVFAPPNLVTGAGLAQFIAEYRERFGDTVADEVWLYDDHGDIERAVPGQPNRLVSYDYRGGFHQSDDLTTRPVDTPTVDLGALDTGAIGRVLTDAPAIARVPDGVVTHMSFDIETFPPHAGAPTVSVYVSNSFDESGWLMVGPAGEVLRVWPFEG
ncbi:DUF1707 SHOCT-like domain-containing protein [Nocardia flavorosea]|uniref:DUF1707 domain-containing protein n=1 Tax=Nocardia flavorosea TaxID=53429 RepID=A0A846YSL9_9NOCA|nr:DUF1707 domain-containing protein [Nocardia flavorosea]NKY60292.1 DUF1707 domain-containing protein [Nocardia flavorosea]